MRAGVCSVQQVLTADAASMVKQAVTLARRRGHAQVTPLHVASVMLASSSGLLRSACLRSHSHPLQCKALELCFNVALNRLPASSSSPLLAPHSSHPSLSNALVAAFKRAQAHQRRASIENQQQPILALKVEIEQLIISILHDPSVSRVMREAGFSSTQLRTNIEQAVSLDVCSQSPAVSSLSKESNNPPLILGTNVSQSSTFIQFGVTLNNPFDEAQEEDVKSLLDAFTSKNLLLVTPRVGEASVINMCNALCDDPPTHYSGYRRAVGESTIFPSGTHLTPVEQTDQDHYRRSHAKGNGEDLRRLLQIPQIEIQEGVGSMSGGIPSPLPLHGIHRVGHRSFRHIRKRN